ncbi:MAG: alpha/beta hydrolase [Actinomycetota bacterium]
MTTSASTLTERELAQIADINRSERPPVVFVHGLWLLAGSWTPWEELFTARGYAPLSIDWPGDPATVDQARQNPQAFAGTSVQDVVARVEAVIDRLDRPPVVIGHSFGGLVAQIVAGRGAVAAAVAIDPAPFKGILGLSRSVVKSSMPVLGNPRNRRRAVTLTPSQFTYAFANAVSGDEAQALYDVFHVAAPGRPVFQVAFANLSFSRATKVDTRNPERGPLLIVSGGADHTVPPKLARAAHRKQSRNPGRTDLLEIEGAGHSLVIDGRWRKVAEGVARFVDDTVPSERPSEFRRA